MNPDTPAPASATATARCSVMEDPSSKRADGQDGEVEGDKATTYRAYKRRYAMVLAVMLLIMCNAGLAFNLASVSYKAADYFDVTLPQVNWFTEVYLIIPIVFSFVSTFTFNKLDMKAGIHIGSALICVGGVTRAVATSGLITAASTQYAVCLTGQVSAAMGSTFIAYTPTKVAQNWFPDDERILATTILVFAHPLGVSVAQVVAPLLVQETQQLPTLNYVYGGLAVLCELLALVCITRARPPTPPSRSAEQGKAQRAPYLQQLRDTVTCLPFLGILFMTAIMMSFSLSLTMLSQQMLCSVGYSELFSGTMMTMINFVGFAGSLVLAVAVNRTKALTPIVKLAYAFAVVSFIALMELYLVPDQHAFLMVVASVFGFFRNGVFPMALEMGIETTYPVEETISSTFITVTGQVLGAVVSNAIVYFAGDLPDGLEGVEVCTDGLTSDLQAKDYSAPLVGAMVVLSLVVVLFVTLFHTPYKRRQVEEHTAATSEAVTTP